MKILLKGFVADGLNEPVRSAVLIDGEKIAAVSGDIYGSSAADKIYSFKNEIIAPGFIDVHGHSDISLLAAPAAESKRFQGFTSEIAGNCGLSVFPLTEKNIDHLQELYAQYNVDLNWQNYPDYQHELAKRQTALRLFSLCGHNTLRSAVAGYDKKTLSAGEINAMTVLLADALQNGAVGLSSGLLYVPGCFADDEELIALMRIVQQFDKVYATHLRSEGDKLTESLETVFRCAGTAGLKKIEISHLKTAGKNNWHKLPEVFSIIDKQRKNGADIHFDRYPYTESQTMLSVILPPPLDTTSDTEVTVKMRQEDVRNSTITSLRQNKNDSDWTRYRLSGTSHPELKKFIGQKFSDIPLDPAELTVELLRHDATTATISASGMSRDNMVKILTSPLCMCGSDGNALPFDARYGSVHPRSFGTAPEFIRILLENNISIGKIIYQMSFLPAKFFNLDGIGTLTPGSKADVTVFDPENISSKADFANPFIRPEGITLSILNGVAEFYR